MNISLERFSLAECIHGVMVWPKNDEIIGKSLPLYGEWSENENIIMSRFINEGDVVLDIGANLGTTALALSEFVGKSGKVLAFEPQSLIAQCLSASLTLNDITNVQVYTLALSSSTGHAFINDEHFAHLGRYGESGIVDSGTKIATSTLDDFELEGVSLVKMDVEGHEFDVIMGGQEFLKQHQPVLYMEAKKDNPKTKQYMKWLFDNGWRCYWHFAFWFRQNNFNNVEKNIWGGTGDMNIVAIPEALDQPADMLELSSPDEDWSQESYVGFYEKNGFPIL